MSELPDRTMPSESDVERNSVILTCTILPGSGLKAFHSQKKCMIPSDIEILDIVILQVILTKSASPCNVSISSGCTEILVDHVRNVSSS